MVRLVSLILIAISLLSCKESEQDRIARFVSEWSGKIIGIVVLLGLTNLFFYSCRSESLENIRVENVICQPICGDDYIIGGARDMKLSNSILTVTDTKSDSMLLFFDMKAGKYLRKAGTRGHGPSEFTMISSLLGACSKNSFSFYDPNKRTYYQTNEITQDEEIRFTPVFRVDSIFPLEIQPMANGQFMATGIYDDCLFCLLDSAGRVQRKSGELFYRDEDEKQVSGIVRSQAYMFDVASSPSKTKFVAFLLSADILAFYQLENDSLCLIKENILSYPEYEYRNNSQHYSGTPKSVPLNYLCAACTEDYVYLLYSGKTFNEHNLGVFKGNLIYVYNWNGDKVAMIRSDKMLKRICLSEDGKTMYAIAYNPDPILVQFSLPQWQ
ncbi:BF3164 family lipoprotein [Bacteroides sp. AN502(2024)]|uniref:BF3164 family lipoprotein n=1 Tax=Bacteroides sp. AN502(2024) TaxID=3160599 RepID=UPI0035119D08